MFRIDLRMHGRHRRWWLVTAQEMDFIGADASWSDRSSMVKVLGWLEDTQLLHNGSWTAFTELLTM